MRKLVGVAVFALAVTVGSMTASSEIPVSNAGASFAVPDTSPAGAKSANIFFSFFSGGTAIADSPAGGGVAAPGPTSFVLLGIGLVSLVGAIRRRVLRAS